MTSSGEGFGLDNQSDQEFMAFGGGNNLIQWTDEDGRRKLWEDERKAFKEKTLSFIAKLKSAQGSPPDIGVLLHLSSGSVNEAVGAASIQEVAEALKERSTIC